MIRAMTGFAKAELKNKKGQRIYFEIRGLNHKFLELSFNLGLSYSYLEYLLKREMVKRINRGRINVILEIDGFESQRIIVNKELARKYFLKLNALRKSLSLNDRIELNTLINLPEVLRVQTDTEDKSLEPKIKRTFKVALEKFLKNREELGGAIYKELKKIIQVLKKKVEYIKKRSDRLLKERAEKIENPEERSNFLNSRDISEEINLLRFHIFNLEKKLESDSPVGKELDFIIQEMQREINTLAAKSFDSKVVSYSIDIKTQIEKIREQIQNVE